MDYGYPFAKTIAIILVSYAVFVLGVLKLLPYSWLGIVTVTVVLGYLNWRVRKKIQITRTMVFEEVLFLCLFFSQLCSRSGTLNPRAGKIHGLRLYAVNSKVHILPPADIWYSQASQLVTTTLDISREPLS